jgi:Dolichyl-phosphate-mannose-protein mannosyltransferase
MLQRSTAKTGSDPAVGTADLGRLQKAWDWFARLLSRRWYLVVAVWLCAVAVSFVGYSRQKPLWMDELLFRWIATLPTVRDIWLALTLGINTDPPLAHLLTHSLASVFGSEALIVRLPSLVGVCVMLLCLFLTLRRQIGPLYALLALALPFCTTLPEYAYEARPYGLMYGCLGIAIYCWAKVGEGRFNRISWNIALGLALAAALACHFYAVFALPAFYLGEGLRTVRRRRVSWLTLGAMVGASATVLLYWPIVVGARQFSGAYFERPTLRSVPHMVNVSLQAFVIPLFAFLVLVAIFGMLGFRFTPEFNGDEDDRSRELTVLALGFLLLPLLAWGAGVLVLKAFTVRYVLHGLFGVFLMLPLFAARAFQVGSITWAGVACSLRIAGLLVRSQRGCQQFYRPTTQRGLRAARRSASETGWRYSGV